MKPATLYRCTWCRIEKWLPLSSNQAEDEIRTGCDNCGAVTPHIKSYCSKAAYRLFQRTQGGSA